MKQPTRVQRKRIKGWRKPENTKCVNRGTKWGNPFKVKDAGILIQNYDTKYWEYFCDGNLDLCVKLYKCLVTGIMQKGEYELKASSMRLMMPWLEHFEKLDTNDLKGFNLACFCNLNNSCHADILLEFANFTELERKILDRIRYVAVITKSRLNFVLKVKKQHFEMALKTLTEKGFIEIQDNLVKDVNP
jgi:hypothetical protein